jgi:PAS domain S-box-containing protein
LRPGRVRFAILLLFFMLAALNAGADLPRRILLLHSFGREFEPYHTFSETFRTELAQQSKEPVDFFDIGLENARYGDAEADAAFESYLHTMFLKHRVDMVMPIGGPAARFVQNHRPQFFPETPTLYAAVDERHLNHAILTTNDAVVTVHIDPSLVLSNILCVLPDTTNLVLVLGDTPLEKFWTETMRQELQPFTNRVGFTWFNQLSFEQILQRAAGLPPHSVIYFEEMTMDAIGVPHMEKEALAKMHAVANAPIFGLHDYQLGLGVVGGPPCPVRELARTTAGVASRILNGEDPARFRPPPMNATIPAYDSRELRRWGIAEASLPPGSLVLFREQSLWQRYTRAITLVVLALLAQSSIIALLLINRARLRRAEQSLLEGKNHLQTVLDMVDEGIYAINERGEIETVNGAGERILGCPAAEIIGQNISRFIPPENGDTLGPDHFKKLCRLRPETTGIGHEVTGRRKDGTAFPMELTVSDLLLKERGVFKLFLRDLTARKKLEAESRRHLVELAHVTRVSTLGELSGSLAHELNQPLTAIMSNAQAAQRFLGKGHSTDLDEIRDILKDIVEENQRAGKIIRNMRAMMKKGAAQMNPLDLNETIREMLHILHSDLIARNVGIVRELDPRLPLVFGDRIQIQQVLINLTLNSCDAMSKQSDTERRLTISTHRHDDGHARVSVVDRGPGIPPDMAEKVFEPFFTTKEQGMGMGLTICNSIIHAHGGRIWFAKQDGTGAVVHFTVPLFTEARP